MADVKRLKDYENKRVRHVYDLERCGGCQKPFEEGEEYTELELTSGDGMTVTHIALCDSCMDEAEDHIHF